MRSMERNSEAVVAVSLWEEGADALRTHPATLISVTGLGHGDRNGRTYRRTEGGMDG
jgi:hypothetical protein